MKFKKQSKTYDIKHGKGRCPGIYLTPGTACDLCKADWDGERASSLTNIYYQR